MPLNTTDVFAINMFNFTDNVTPITMTYFNTNWQNKTFLIKAELEWGHAALDANVKIKSLIESINTNTDKLV